MKSKNMKAEQNAVLIDSLLKYLKETDLNEELEIKPDEHIYTQETDNLKKKTEELNRDNSTELDKQLINVGNNIAIKFFELDDTKFQAVMQRMSLWRV